MSKIYFHCPFNEVCISLLFIIKISPKILTENLFLGQLRILKEIRKVERTRKFGPLKKLADQL